MPVAEWWQCRRPQLLWWSLAVAVAAALKFHFSVAAASELQWMLRPLALLLQAIAGWRFERNAAGEWFSVAAGIVLIKACAGINFMVLSFAGWCWLWQPLPGVCERRVAWLPALRLGRALACAWATALLVNALRILAIVYAQPSFERWLQPAAAHRLLGLLVYLPALGLQWRWMDRERPGRALVIAAALYVALMLVLPLLTGQAAANRGAYLEHCLVVLALLLPPLLLTGMWRRIAGS